jgi:hypothetical protein
VWSKVIATVITGMGASVLVLVVTMSRSCGSTEQAARAPEEQPTPEAKPSQTAPKDEPPPEPKPAGPIAGEEGKRAAAPPPVVPPEPKPESPAPIPTVFIDCRMGTLPRAVPASGRIYALVPQPLPQENGGGGLTEFFAQPGSEWNWGKRTDFVYRCEVTNYATDLLLDLEMDFAYEMRRPIPVPDAPKNLKQGEVTLSRIWLIKIAKVDVGAANPFVFYLYNCCQDRFVYFRAPSTARGAIAGSQVEILVRQSKDHLSQPLMPVRPEEKQ